MTRFVKTRRQPSRKRQLEHARELTRLPTRCAECLDERDRHEIEQPYPCYDCDCTGFEYVKREAQS